MNCGKSFIHGTMHRLLWASFALGSLALLPGCSGSASQEELGEIHYQLPRIPGMEIRYHLDPMMQSRPGNKTTNKNEQENSAATPAEANVDPLKVFEESTPSSAPPAERDSTPPNLHEEPTSTPPEPGEKPAPTPEKSTAP